LAAYSLLDRRRRKGGRGLLLERPGDGAQGLLKSLMDLN